MASKNNGLNEPNQPPAGTTPRGPMLVLIAGSVAIAALVGWALTRSVELPPQSATAVPAPMPSTATNAATTTVSPTAASSTAAPPPTPAPPAQSPDKGGVDRIAPQQLKSLIDTGRVTVIDVRDSVSYTTGHIPGAVHIPFARVESESRYLPKDKPIVAYCT